MNPSRLESLKNWVGQCLSQTLETWEVASLDASYRRYYRTNAQGVSYIVMDAPPQHENASLWLEVARELREGGVRVPEIWQVNLEQGFVLLSDFGDETLLARLQQESLASLDRRFWYQKALLVLLQVQSVSAQQRPLYDGVLLKRELDIYLEWYVKVHRQKILSVSEQELWDKTCDLLIQRHLNEHRVYVHRDFHSRNLMILEKELGVLDFQDAVFGPLSYDVVSLLRDAYIELGEEEQLDLLAFYWEQARAKGVAVPVDFGQFYQDFEWMGVQRHIKILGVFARLCWRDHKPQYLAAESLLVRSLWKTCERYRELRPLGRWVLLMSGLDIGIVEGMTF